VNLDRGAGYGDMLSWPPGFEPGLGEQSGSVQRRLDLGRFYAHFTTLLSR
jgi:purine nucleosidase